jgi:hypothetical protein
MARHSPHGIQNALIHNPAAGNLVLHHFAAQNGKRIVFHKKTFV